MKEPVELIKNKKLKKLLKHVMTMADKFQSRAVFQLMEIMKMAERKTSPEMLLASIQSHAMTNYLMGYMDGAKIEIPEKDLKTENKELKNLLDLMVKAKEKGGGENDGQVN